MFPEARFVHIVRDPYVVFASTVKLWKSLYQIQGLQLARFQGLEEYVLRSFERMYESFEQERPTLAASQLVELRYEDLVREPVEQLRALYERLELGDFAAALPAINGYLRGVRDYQTNRHQLAPELAAEVDRRWGPFMRRFGYPLGG
jgi:hypothetical protein